MHLEDVLLARADLDEAVLAVGADVGPLAGVDHAVVVERLALLELLLAEVALDRLLAVRLHVQLEAGLVLVVEKSTNDSNMRIFKRVLVQTNIHSFE